MATQKRFAADLGVGQSTLSRYERGQMMPDAYVLWRIAAYAGTTVEALLKAEGRESGGTWDGVERRKDPILRALVDNGLSVLRGSKSAAREALKEILLNFMRMGT